MRRSWLMLTVVALVAAMLYAASQARAQSTFPGCVDHTQSWTTGFNAGSLSGVTYIVSLPVTYKSLGYLIGLFRDKTIEILVGIPANVAGRFQGQTNGDTIWKQLKPGYHEVLLVSPGNCPLLINDAPYSTTGTPLWSR